MKILISIIFMFLLNNLCIAQPLRTSAITVDSIFYKKQRLYFAKQPNSNNYKYSQAKKQYSYVGISVNSKTNFIYKNDTMQIKLLFDSYSPLSFHIKNLHFRKGYYTVNLKECIERLNKNTYPIIIKNFPCDCLYRNEEDQ
ncbi:hypothetical protein EG359_03055 [Chryseobacterium joostei]|uniref:Uncharacterized protein n=1 Tax=Chryseobacterium joostei TaxID=112234 RepID=A0A1N7HYD6_9FLAO|nr:hypothetical protein [Chryseobacterium joostei]AZA98648.1 hypothetical protein EG359_03055 [Chryseobacterium joostei]SIS29740.1 hypothetical protein SAMN05421768_101753 [Chryseobacterium joostei]